MKLASGGNTVSVPPGAKAGQLTLHPCHYGTDAGSYAADCGTLVVKENRHDPHSRLIALPVTRIRAHSPHPGDPVFRLQGGPGITNMDFTAASRFTARHDVVLVGYRGVDSSTKLDCPEVDSARDRARDFLTRQSYASVAAAFQACAQRLKRNGVDLAGYTLPERVDDLDAARSALGYERVDLVSESAGTRTAMIYGWRYPQRVHRSVMLGVNPPGHFLWDARTTGDQIRSYAALCAHDASCRARTPDLAASLHTAFAHMPHRFWFLPISAGDARAAAFFGLMNATAEGDTGHLGAEDARHARLGEQGRRQRRLVPGSARAARLPARPGVGGRRLRGGKRPRLRASLLREQRRPRLRDRRPWHRPDLGRRQAPRQLAPRAPTMGVRTFEPNVPTPLSA